VAKKDRATKALQRALKQRDGTTRASKQGTWVWGGLLGVDSQANIKSARKVKKKTDKHRSAGKYNADKRATALVPLKPEPVPTEPRILGSVFEARNETIKQNEKEKRKAEKEKRKAEKRAAKDEANVCRACGSPDARVDNPAGKKMPDICSVCGASFGTADSQWLGVKK
jgi:hypothetical protein